MRLAPLAAAAIAVGPSWGTTALASAGAVARVERSSANAPPTRSTTAPNRPPLSTYGTGGEGGSGEETSGLSPQGEADPLVSNGLGSPTCRWADAGELPVASRRDCETSGFVASAAPTGDYGLDVHIDTGLPGLSSGWLLSAVQDMVIAPIWMALVWAVHSLVVMLEWSFTIDLLDSASAHGLAGGLRRAQSAVTAPWLPLALAVASALVAYNGLVRRRIADTLGEALVMGAMMVLGTWAILDPTGTVGALGRWANSASLGTLSVATGGSPATPARALAQSMGVVFAQGIEVPWCYLEFGDVSWCREPARLEGRLRAAAQKEAGEELAQIGCANGSQDCVPSGSASARSLERVADLLRDAQSNGAVFLALPPNGPARNSINDQGSLLRTICQTGEATNCRGAAAPEAEFRTNGGTWSRLGGLLLIAVGLLGLLLLLGCIVLRLLSSALMSVLYLLIAPVAVLAPAFGETGRGAFRGWASRLLGAVVGKLIFSFLLGAVLAVIDVLATLRSLGWWTQWLLMSAFWWGAFFRRDRILGVTHGALGDDTVRRRSVVRRLGDTLETRRGMALARWAKDRRRRPAGEVAGSTASRSAPSGSINPQSAIVAPDGQAARMLATERREGLESRARSGERHERVSAKREQLERIRREQARAGTGGERRRVSRLAHRALRVSGEVEQEEVALRRGRELARLPADGSSASTRRVGAELDERRRLLDSQARHPPSARDYRELAALAGYGHEAYDALDARDRRRAHLEIDRELARRRHTLTGPSGPIARPQPDAPVREATDTSGMDRRARSDRPRTATHPQSRPESSVMRDAREVAAGRKRQLGKDRR